jgi:hypothetical protein
MKQKHLPSGLPQEVLRSQYAASLDAHSAGAIRAVRSLIGRELADGITSAAVIIFPDEYCEGNLTIRIAFDGPNKRISPTDESLFRNRPANPG